jgi:hypothetical protein
VSKLSDPPCNPKTSSPSFPEDFAHPAMHDILEHHLRWLFRNSWWLLDTMQGLDLHVFIRTSSEV